MFVGILFCLKLSLSQSSPFPSPSLNPPPSPSLSLFFFQLKLVNHPTLTPKGSHYKLKFDLKSLKQNWFPLFDSKLFPSDFCAQCVCACVCVCVREFVMCSLAWTDSDWQTKRNPANKNLPLRVLMLLTFSKFNIGHFFLVKFNLWTSFSSVFFLLGLLFNSRGK